MEKVEKQAKPFIKWVGGKGQLLSQIDNALPKWLFMEKEVTYIEPFVGGGAMLFYMLEKFQNIKKAVINDINKDFRRAGFVLPHFIIIRIFNPILIHF